MSTKKGGPETFAAREVVLAKVRGFPPWPGMVIDPESVPKAASKERPANKKSAVYAVRFFPAGNHAWLHPRDLYCLTTAQITAFVDDKTKKAGNLTDGYRTALDPTAWEAEHAPDPPATKKRNEKGRCKGKKREDRATNKLDENVLEEPEKAGKKRKRAASPSPAKGKAAAAAKGKKGGKAKQSKAAVERKDDAKEDVDGEEKEERPNKKSKGVAEDANLESNPEAVRVCEWRHKLQKIFLSNKTLPKEDEMPAIDTLFTTIEKYDKMNIGYLSFSRIGKVMRYIHLLGANKVPRDNEYNFRARANALVEKWRGIFNSNESDAAEAEVAEGTALNGTGANEGDLTMMDVTMD